jgi:Flp pilus assembly pilin Flp
MTVISFVPRLRDLAGRAASEDGQALVEYALLLSLVSLAVVVSAQAFGLGVSGLFSTVVANYP